MSTPKKIKQYLKNIRTEYAQRELSSALYKLCQRQEFAEALPIAEALIEFSDLPSEALTNALYLIQPDNTGLPFDSERAKRFLAAALLYASYNPAIHLNASGVYMHLEQPEQAMRQLLLAKQVLGSEHFAKRDAGFNLNDHLNDELLRPLQSHPRWGELTNGLLEPVQPVTWYEVAHECFSEQRYNDAVPALLFAWDNTRSSEIADLLDAISKHNGQRAGYMGEHLENLLGQNIKKANTILDSCSKRLHAWNKFHPETLTLVDYQDKETDAQEYWTYIALDDPRFCTMLTHLLKQPINIEEKRISEEVWRAIIRHLVAMRDQRMIPILEELSHNASDWMPARMATVLSPIAHQAAVNLKRFPRPEGLNTEEQQALHKLKSMLPHPSSSPFEAAWPKPTPNHNKNTDSADEVLELWQRTHHPRVADILDCMALRQKRKPLEHKLKQLQPLQASQHLWQAKGENDPRVTQALLRLIQDPPFLLPIQNGNGVSEFWEEVLDTFKAIKDPRTIEPIYAFANRIQALTARVDEEAEEDMYCSSPLGPFLEYQLKKVAQQLKEYPIEELSTEEKQQCALWEKEYAKERQKLDEEAAQQLALEEQRKKLLMDIMENPEADEPRAAYVNFLKAQSTDDPVADFIERQLLFQDYDEHFEQPEEQLSAPLLGNLAQAVVDPQFERGFAVSGEIDRRKVYCFPSHLIGDPMWGTFKQLSASVDGVWRKYDLAQSKRVERTEMIDLVAHSIMKHLTHLNGVSAFGLSELVRRNGPRPFSQIIFQPGKDAQTWWPQCIQALQQLPSLQTLIIDEYSLRDASKMTPLLEAPLTQVKQLEIQLNELRKDDTDYIAWFSKLQASVYPRVVIRLEYQPYQLHFTRGKHGKLSRLEAVHLGPSDIFHLDQFCNWLSFIPAEHIEEFALIQGTNMDANALPAQHELAQLQEILSTFPDLNKVTLLPAGDSQESIRALVKQLSDSKEIALKAAKCLDFYQDPQTRRSLVKCVRDHTSPEVKATAFNALESLVQPDIINFLLEIVQQPDDYNEGLLLATNMLLGHLDIKAVKKPMILFFERSSSQWDKNKLAIMLAHLGATKAIASLETNYKKEKSVEVLWALAMLDSPKAHAWAMKALPEDEKAAIALAFIGTEQDRAKLAPLVAEEAYIMAYGIIEIIDSILSQGASTHINAIATSIQKWHYSETIQIHLVLKLAQVLGDQRFTDWQPVTDAILGWVKRHEERRSEYSKRHQNKPECLFKNRLMQQIQEQWTVR